MKPRHVVSGACLVGLLLLFFFDPRRHGFYPPCLFHLATGLYCPGCGTTRAAYCLLHGSWREALSYNLLVFVLPPLLLLEVVGRRRGRGARGRRILLPWVILLLIVGFGVARNLPWPPFNRLAPGGAARGLD